MGKMSLILVVGLAVILGITGTTMLKRGSQSRENNMALYERAQARNVAKGSIEIGKRQLRSDPSLNGNFTYNILGGKAFLSVKEKIPGKRDILLMKTVGTYGNASTIIGLTATKGDLPAPPVTGALGVSYLSKAKINLGKGAYLDGNNHDVNGLRSAAYGDIAGLSLGHPDHYDGLDYKPKDVKIKGKGDVDPNIEVQTPQPDYYDWAMELAKGADVTYNGRDVKTVETLGTLANPQVTYVKGKTKFNEEVTGAGILIVDGTCKFSKSVEFTGLIFAVGDSLMSEKATMGKGSTLIGAMMVAGKKTHVKIGDADLLYSAEAVNRMLGLVRGHMAEGYVFTNWVE